MKLRQDATDRYWNLRAKNIFDIEDDDANLLLCGEHEIETSKIGDIDIVMTDGMSPKDGGDDNDKKEAAVSGSEVVRLFPRAKLRAAVAEGVQSKRADSPPQDGSGGIGDVKLPRIVTRSSSQQKLQESVSAGEAREKHQQQQQHRVQHLWEGWCSSHNQSSEGEMTTEGAATTATDDEDDHFVTPSPERTPRSILKKRSSTLVLGKKSTRRITFNDMMTVFSDSHGTSLVAMGSEASPIPDDLYETYEPPPEYQDVVDFEPPEEYKDDRFETVYEEREEDACSEGTVVTSFCEEEAERFDCRSSDETLTDEQQVLLEKTTERPSEDDDVPDFRPESVPRSDESSQLQQQEVVAGASATDDDDDEIQPRVNSLLTEENLKQHEQMMKQEVGPRSAGSTTPPPPLPASLPPASSPPPPPTNRKTSAKVMDELSPPLKQLSVQVANEPPPPGDDWQIELSPLNSGSAQETESDSSLSSQDTIIMMTSDESKRNEEHIKESMRIYEGLKKMDSSSLSSSGSDETKSSTMDSETPSSDSHTTSSSGGTTAEGWTSNDIRRVIERNAMRRSMQRFTETRKKQIAVKKAANESGDRRSASLAERIKQLTCVDNDTDSGVDSEKSGSDSSSSSSSSLANRQQQHHHQSGALQRPAPLTSRQRHSLAYHGYISPLGGGTSSPPRFPKLAIHRSASEVNVQSSLKFPRERLDGGPERSHAGLARCLSANDNFDKSICDTSTIDKLGIESNRFNSRLADGGVDELELFVKQDSDRIDRIRQRYSYSSETDSGLEISADMLVRKPSVRGIKPKFGSTTEILRQMQTEIQPPIYASPKSIGSHMTWPYNLAEASRTPNLCRHPQMPSSQSSGTLYNVIQAPVEVDQTVRIRRGRESLKVLVTKDERGTPEGASSSPKVSSDPLCPTLQKSAPEEAQPKDGVIFYSMNV